MAKRGWTDKHEYRIELAGRNYYFTIHENKNQTHRVDVKEFRKSQGLHPAQTRSITIFENNLRDIVQALVKVADKIGADVGVKLVKKTSEEPIEC